jgi:hypothetical protein
MKNETMEYAGNLPVPIATLTKTRDPDVTLFVTQAGEFQYLPTEEQARLKTQKMMAKFKPENFWAQMVSKFKKGKEDFLCAYVKRDFSADHSRSDFSDMPDDEFWIGRMVIGIPLMVTDNRQHSDTQNERIPQSVKSQMPDGSVVDIPVLGKKGWYTDLQMNKKNIEMMKTMCGLTATGLETQYINVLLAGGRNVSEDDQEEFFSTSTDEALAQDRGIRKEIREAKQVKGKQGSAHLV